MGRRREKIWNRKSYGTGRETTIDTPRSPARSEAEVFSELTRLCTTPGYIHALSYLVFRDSIVTGGDEFTKEDFLKIYSPGRLIRTEFAVLIGLMLKSDIDVAIPDQNSIQEMIDSSDRLMLELHEAILAPAHMEFRKSLDLIHAGEKNVSPLGSGPALREAMFYGGESAFTWHYLNFARSRYVEDDDWLLTHRGFTMDQAVRLTELLIDHLALELFPRFKELRHRPPTEWTMLSLFCFTKEELVTLSAYSEETVQSFLDAFSVSSLDHNVDFTGPFSLNVARIRPFIQLPDGRYTSFQEYITSEAMYDNPFYWMITDDNYKGTASRNRGNFSEKMCFEFLNRVFPSSQVIRNVEFKISKKKTDAEADAIVLFGRRAFIFQVKSKRLTENAKSGDETSISRDFKSAVQAAYNQAVNCIEAIRAKVPAYDSRGSFDLSRFDKVDKFYPICVTSEHYPALSFQVAQFLTTYESDYITAPLVFDLFTLDIISEFLRSPLYFVDYLVKRSIYHGRISSSHEMVIFSYHLKKNLYIPPDYHFLAVEDDFLVELDLAVNVRRRGIPGADTPTGILTRNLDTPLGHVLQQIDKSDRPEVHEIGELLLGLAGDAYDRLDRFLRQIIDLTVRDGKSHDVSVPVDEDRAGLTIHCNSLPPEKAADKLTRHCEVRKYAQRADRWFGLCLDPNGNIRLAMGLRSPWRLIPGLEDEIGDFKVRAASHFIGPEGRNDTPGRNAPCPCESGRKFKHCHGRR